METRSVPQPLFTALLWAAALAPAAELLPSARWIAPLFAAAPAALGGWAMGCLSGEGGLAAELARRSRGYLIYMVWGTALLALRLRLCARRLMASGPRDGALWFFLLGAAAVILWLGWGEAAALARAARIFLWPLGVVGGGVLLLALSRVEITRLTVWWDDLLPAAGEGLSVAGGLGWVLYGAFLLHRVRPGGGWGRLLWFFPVLTAARAVVLGVFGPGLLLRLEDPFFALAKSVGVEGAFQRVESVVAALWILADLAMGGLLLFALRELWECLLPGRGRPGGAGCLVVAAAGGLLLFSDGGGEFFAGRVVPWVNLVLGLVLPLLLIGPKRAYIVVKKGGKRQI